MKKLTLLALALLLTGCGGDSSSEETSVLQEIFTVDETNWAINLPESWKKVPAPKTSFNIMFLAYKGSENFVVMKSPNVSEDVVGSVRVNAQKDFHSYHEKSATETTLRFEGKTDPTASTREFIQKIYVLPDRSAFLIGSCSLPVQSDVNDQDCLSILDSWEISVDKK